MQRVVRKRESELRPLGLLPAAVLTEQLIYHSLLAASALRRVSSERVFPYLR